ncbi:YkoF family thiamine/hydroxymethylpyrimidine-binding protein [Thermohalobacter berrensis]|nr:YkoF family thiamine/hydroxymethylpyrimidine-binding protein [Thermohalobacter berrensis]
MEKIASCEISFIPIMSKDYISDIKKVLEIIKSYNLEHNIGILSTTIRGNKDDILKLIKNIYNTMDEICSFTMDIKISNICGCEKDN